MAITLLQSVSKNAGGVASSTLAFPSNVTAGSMLVCHVWNGSIGAAQTASDPNNGSYHADVTNSNAALTATILTVANAAAGATTVTFGTNGSGQLRCTIEEWGGIATANYLDQTSSGQAGSGTTADSGTTGATTQANELVLSNCSTSNSHTDVAASGYTLDANSNSNRPSVSYLIVSSTGTQDAVTTITNDAWVALIATYKASASGPLPVATQLQQPGPIGGPFNIGQFAPFQYAIVTPAVVPINPVVGSLGFPIGIAGPGIGPSPRATFQRGLVPMGPAAGGNLVPCYPIGFDMIRFGGGPPS